MVNKMMSSKKVLVMSVSTIVLFIGMLVYAESVGTFDFEMNRAVYGTTKYSLKNKETIVKTKATTYRYSDDTTIESQGYKVSLHKTTSSGTFVSAGKADGTTKSVNFGKISEGKYNVDVMVNNPQDSGTVWWYIKGTGSVNQ